MIPYLEDYVDFYTLFIGEEKDLYDKIKVREKSRLDLLKEGPSDDPMNRLTQAEVLIHWAMIEAKFDNFTSAALNGNKAFKLLKKNEADFPDHMGTQRLISLIRAGVGTIPKKFMWLVKLVSSFEGSVDEGVNGLKKVYEYGKKNPDFIYARESLMLYTIIASHFGNDAENMHRLLKTVSTNYETEPLLIFTKISVALESDHNDDVINLLSDLKVGEDQYPFEYLSYILGLAKLARNDVDADRPLLQFVNNFNGQNYIKESYQKLAWHELIQGNDAGYHRYMKYAISEGSTVVDADQQALMEAEKGIAPQRQLLKARLLNDGGYHKKANEVLKSINVEKLSFAEKLEYYYRGGRIQQQSGNEEIAIKNFIQTIEEGRDSGYYFACSAALNLGRIYESISEKSIAQKYYEECLSISSDAYESSLHQKAKAGLSRLKG